jgi:hypothetical protein
MAEQRTHTAAENTVNKRIVLQRTQACASWQGERFSRHDAVGSLLVDGRCLRREVLVHVDE